MPNGVETYDLVPPPPVRAYAIAGLVALVGAGLTVTARASGWGTGVVAIGLALLATGVVLLVAAVLAIRRLRVRVHLFDDGFRVTGPAGEREGAWSDIIKVTLSADGHRLTLHHTPERRTYLVTPHGPNDPELERLGMAIARRLDADRGYTNLV